MSTLLRSTACLVLCAVISLPVAVAISPHQDVSTQTSKPVQPAAHPVADRGERAFNAHCSRCHYAPDTLNPRITGTVIRHMRVRANLSAADERDILRFLNP